jgi:hypothetical protein
MFVCWDCCVLSDRGLCDELITRPEESYRLWCIVVCDLFIKLTNGVPQESYRREKLWFHTVRWAYHTAQWHYCLLFIINDYPHWRIFQIKAIDVFFNILYLLIYWNMINLIEKR